MQSDARRLASGSTLEADVCIVGSGPAGITLARELRAGGMEVLVLESGASRHDGWSQGLNEGELRGGLYAGLRETRHRQIGGAPNIWNTPVLGATGGKYVPLDPWDFTTKAGSALSGWPFDFAHLEPFYRRAQEVCGLGPFQYGGDTWAGPERPVPALEGGLEIRVYQFGLGRLFTRTYVEELSGQSGFHLWHHATACRFETNGDSERVHSLEFAGRPGQHLRVRARSFVLAAGGIENARLLLLSGLPGGSSGEPAEEGVEDGAKWVGRCFMEHPRDFSMTLTPYSPRLYAESAFFDPHQASDGTVVGGRIGLSGAAVQAGRLPNASVTLLPKIRERSSLVDWAARLWLCPHSAGRRGFRGGYGWSRMKTPGRWLDGFRLVLNTEQRPDPENHVFLSKRLDPFGLPRAGLHWRWTEAEQRDLDRLKETVAGGLERSGMGRVHLQKGVPPDPNACHHAGTTRMSESAEGGVVDPDCRVHGMENLYVVGGSVFPTAGYANPTLTVVALAIRLAGHLILTHRRTS